MGNEHLELFKQKYFPDVCNYCNKNKYLFENKCEIHKKKYYHIECKSKHYNELVKIHGINKIFLLNIECICCINNFL